MSVDAKKEQTQMDGYNQPLVLTLHLMTDHVTSVQSPMDANLATTTYFVPGSARFQSDVSVTVAMSKIFGMSQQKGWGEPA